MLWPASPSHGLECFPALPVLAVVIAGADEDGLTCVCGVRAVSCFLAGVLGCVVVDGMYALPAGGGAVADVAAQSDGEFARTNPTVVPDAAITASTADPASTPTRL